jgi:uncharacterized membrane protein YdjX (TVP38/TMEM64 family)
MDATMFNWQALHDLAPLLALFDSELLVAAIFFLATAILIAFCVPGVLLPIAIGSGAVLGPWGASAAVLLGAAAGSQLLFLAARHFAGERVQARLGPRLHAFQDRFAARGIWYVIGLRVIGTPHFLVTAASALTPMRSSKFAAATLLGFLPAVTLAAATGSAI